MDFGTFLIELLRKLVHDHAILLVEHDKDAVFAVANILTVMVNGNVLESGPPEQIRASRAVQEAYLGAEEERRKGGQSNFSRLCLPVPCRDGREKLL